MPYLTDLDVRILPEGRYVLLKDFIWVHPCGGSLRVPRGFITDFASVPRGLRWLVNGHEHTRKPAVLHDFLYRKGIGTKKDADLVFRAAMRDTDTPAWKRILCYLAVALGGRSSWRGK